MRCRNRWWIFAIASSMLAAFVAIPARAQTTGALNVAWLDSLPGNATDVTIYQPMTHASGAVSLLYADPPRGLGVKTVGADREQLSTINPGQNFAAVGKNGDVYFTAESKLSARTAAGAERWSVALPQICQSPSSLTGVAVGADGSLYALAGPQAINQCAGSFQLVKYDAATGANIFTKVLGDARPSAYALAVHKTGVAVQVDKTVRYFSAAGAEVGTLTGPNTNVQVNADGVAMYSLVRMAGAEDSCASDGTWVIDGILFRTLAGSQTQANLHDCVESYAMQLLSNGGALINALQGANTVLIGVNQNGSVAWRRAVPRINGDTSQVAYLSARTDSNGNVVVAKQTAAGDRYAVDVQVLSADTGALLASFNTASVDTSVNYFWASPNGYPGSIGLAQNRLYLTLAESVNGTRTTKLYAFDLTGLSMDYPRGTVWGMGGQNPPPSPTPTPSPAPKPKLNYVALGDSFSSGEGARDYYSGTDIPARKSNHNMCHRSKNAYSPLLAADPTLNLNGAGFFACSGATTANIVGVYQYETQPPQTLLLSKKTDLVTLTIGGNDVGFGDFATACADPLASCVGDPHRKMVKKINDALPGKLAKTLDAIGRAISSSARVVVVGYPLMVQQPRSLLQSCGVLSGPEMLLARDVITRLNDAERQAVADANLRNKGKGPRFVFLDVNGSDSVFKGRELCTAHSAFNSLKFNGKVDNIFVESLHPNVDGQALYALIIKRYLLSAS